MKRPSFGLFIIAIVFLTVGTASSQIGRILPTHHVRAATAKGEAPLVGRLPRAQTLDLAIMLPLRNPADLDNLLADLYDPRNPSYANYLTVQEFTERFGPTRDDYEKVIAFARASGMKITDTAPNRMLIDVTATVGVIEKAFHIELGLYKHPTENRVFYAPDREPSPDLDVPLWHIAGLDNYSLPHTASRQGEAGHIRPMTGTGPGGSYLPSDMRAAYYGTGSLTGSGQTVGIFSFGGYLTSDLTLFFQQTGMQSSVPVNNVLVDGYNGACTAPCDDGEQILDIVNAIGIAPGLSQVRVYEAAFGSGGHDPDIFNKMATENIAKQIDCSWLWHPADPSSDDPIFQEFAAQGQTLFVASGDWASYPNPSDPFYFPPEDAYVTAVGGTHLTTNGAGGSWQSETAWSDAGGGYSQDGIAIPSYQHISGVINSSNNGSTTLRNVPDVAAEADFDNFDCDNGVCSGNWGGTSFAAPRWAGYMALVNQQNAANGKATLGFINPFIYGIGTNSAYGGFFHDITSGTNGGFNAVTGYDLVTGWGSPSSTDWFLTPTASVNPTFLTFVIPPCGDVPPPKTATLTNSGPGILVPESIAIQGSGSSSFGINSQTCKVGQPVQPQGTCTVSVIYTGSTQIAKATLYIYDTATNGPQTVSLTGSTGYCPP